MKRRELPEALWQGRHLVPEEIQCLERQELVEALRQRRLVRLERQKLAATLRQQRQLVPEERSDVWSAESWSKISGNTAK